MTPIDATQWKYPTLSKPESDGAFCYHIQRRISARISVRLARHMGPNAATGFDMLIGLAAAVLVLLDHWVWGVVLIQVFGIFSCVDGEIARIQEHSSKLGDFLDTLTDRVTEFLFIAAVSISLCSQLDPLSALSAGFAMLGGVFVLTTSSEKFRSAWQKSYPKRRLERWFCFLSAGSETRLLILSIGLLASVAIGDASILLWMVWALTGVTYLNFLVRLALIHRHFRIDGSGHS